VSCIGEASGESLLLTSADVGHTLRVTVTAENSVGATIATSEATAVVIGKPVNTELPKISGEAVEGRTLSASKGGWTQEPTEYAFKWSSCNAKAECKEASGETYSLTSADVGNTVTVTVTASNVVGPGSATSAPTATVTGKPVNSELPKITREGHELTGEVVEGQTLEASAGRWGGTEPIEIAKYVWLHCKGGVCHEVASGEKATTYKPTSSDIGDTIEVEVTAKNPVGSATATSTPTTTVVGNPPKNIEAPKIMREGHELTGEVTEGQKLEASEGKWEGTLPLSYEYQWERDESGTWTAIEGASASSYTVQSRDVGMTLRVTVTAKNVAGSASDASKATATVEAVGGAAVAWGENQYGGVGTIYADPREEWPADAAEGVTKLTQVSAGSAVSLGLLGSGEVIAWGNNKHGQLGDDGFKATWELGKSYVLVDQLEKNELGETEPRPLTGVTQVAANDDGGLALIGKGSDSTVDAWGFNQYGTLGDGRGANPEATRTATPVKGLSGVRSIAAAGGASYAVMEPHGAVMAWGSNIGGQLSTEGWPKECEKKNTCECTEKSPCECKKGSEKTECERAAALTNPAHKCWTETKWELCGKTPRYVVEKNGKGEEKRITGVKQVLAGNQSAYALLEDGEVISWGDDQKGQLGQAIEAGGNTNFTPPGRVVRSDGEPLRNVKQVAAGANHALALLEDGEVVGWGDDSKGELGEGTATTCLEGRETECFERAVPIEGLAAHGEVQEIGAGQEFSSALIAGEVYMWGRNGEGELGNGEWLGPESCLTKHQEEKYAEEEKEAEREEEEGKKTAEETKARITDLEKDEKVAGPCSRKPLLVALRGREKEPGVWEAGGPLQHVTAIDVGKTHVVALLEHGASAPEPLFKVASEKVESKLALNLAWTAGVSRVIYQLYEYPGEDGEAEGGCEAEETVGEECAEEYGGSEGGSGPPQSIAVPHVGHYNHEHPKGESKVFREAERAYANPGRWTGEGLTFTYQWERCPLVGECVSISGATGETYTLTAEDVKQTIRVTVTAKNSEGSASGTSWQTPIVKSATAPRNLQGESAKVSGKSEFTFDSLKEGKPSEDLEEMPVLKGVAYELKLSLGEKTLRTVAIPTEEG
jgi:alpha-tubulin suppressor-like RCC1 family protein